MWSSVENYVEKRVTGHTETGEGVSTKIRRADVEKVSGSVRR
jgi:hypothetical protein